MHLSTQLRGRATAVWTLAGLSVLEALLVWLSPAERILGGTVRWVYLHGAMARVALICFGVSALVNLVYLGRPTETLRRWGATTAITALVLWAANALTSTIPTYLTWGVWIQWSEPRTQFTFNILLVALVIHATVFFLIESPRVAALIYALLGGLVVGILPFIGLIRHPLDPVGSSPSPTIRLFYLAILIVMALIGLALAVVLHQRGQVRS